MFVFVVVSSLLFEVFFCVVCGLSEFGGGLGCRMLLVPAWSVLITCFCAVVPIGVGSSLLLSVPVDGNDNFVCRLPFVSLSFAGVTFVCLVFSPRRGDE